jgi:hypothetical protein
MKPDFPANTSEFIGQFTDAQLRVLLKTFARLYQKIDGFWYVALMEKHGNEAAFERDMWVWDKVTRYEIKVLREALEMGGDTSLQNFVDILMVSPMTMATEYHYEPLPDGSLHLIFSYCPILAGMEKEGKGRERKHCNEVDVRIMGSYARAFGADLSLIPVKLPPRAERSGPCCEWLLRKNGAAPEKPLQIRMGLDRLPRAILLKLLRAYARLYQVIDAWWYISARKKWGDPFALERDFWVWKRVTRSEMKIMMETLGLKGRKDLASFMTAFLATPMNINSDFRLTWRDEHHLEFALDGCPVLDALEKEGEGREEAICRKVDVMIFKGYAHAFNPAITVEPLELPPRRDRSRKPVCRWSISLPV